MVVPVVNAGVKKLAHQHRQTEQRIAVFATRFQQQHSVGRVG
jgi:hypothetical protein